MSEKWEKLPEIEESEDAKFQRKTEAIRHLLGMGEVFSEEDKKRIAETEKFLSKIPEKDFNAFESRYAADLRDIADDEFGYKDINEKIREILREKLKGKVVVDLGCGLYTGDMRRIFGKAIGVRGYVGVDKYDMFNEVYLEGEATDDKKYYNIDTIHVQADMLKLISTLPDKSVNYIMNGIDFTIIKNPKYWNRLFEELERTTEEGGIVCGYTSSAFLGGHSFKDIVPQKKDNNTYSGFFIFEKQKDKE